MEWKRATVWEPDEDDERTATYKGNGTPDARTFRGDERTHAQGIEDQKRRK